MQSGVVAGNRKPSAKSYNQVTHHQPGKARPRFAPHGNLINLSESIFLPRKTRNDTKVKVGKPGCTTGPIVASRRSQLPHSVQNQASYSYPAQPNESVRDKQ
ncbi:hypothetical protein PM8797T_01894 [Gimesia maris DSM 8797]|nr:hypothetical protein PM8797T_01894 [Gimesia maris DSM 8797]